MGQCRAVDGRAFQLGSASVRRQLRAVLKHGAGTLLGTPLVLPQLLGSHGARRVRPEKGRLDKLAGGDAEVLLANLLRLLLEPRVLVERSHGGDSEVLLAHLLRLLLEPLVLVERSHQTTGYRTRPLGAVDQFDLLVSLSLLVALNLLQ